MAEAAIEPVDAGETGDAFILHPQGDWTILRAEALSRELDALIAAPPDGARVLIALDQVGALDTAGAHLLRNLALGLTERGCNPAFARLSRSQRSLLEQVIEVAHPTHEEPPKRAGSAVQILGEVGETVAAGQKDLADATAVFGRIVAGLGRGLASPRRIRIASVVHQMEYTGLRAVPIIVLMSFLIGAIIAQQGAFHFRKFGAELFVVDMVGILVLREIAVLITAIMVAGRSGSAFTAEIGSMKMREEIDALSIIGVDPIEVLVLPRVLALVLALPLLTFLSDITCLAGALLVTWFYGGIEPNIFLDRLREAVVLSTFWVGIIKAPFMALIIGLIACMEGLRVAGSAESLGRQTTASVVKAIFMVIVMDGIFAIYFAALDF
jgi:phospholipid/cholesterol/gamma-HCH transport system permease protein